MPENNSYEFPEGTKIGEIRTTPTEEEERTSEVLTDLKNAWAESKKREAESSPDNVDFEEQCVIAAARQRFSPETGYYDKNNGIVQLALRNEARPYVTGVLDLLEKKGLLPRRDSTEPSRDYDSNTVDLESGELGKRVQPVLAKIREATVAQDVGLPSAPQKILTRDLGRDRTEDDVDSFTADADSAWAERDKVDPDYGTPNYKSTTGVGGIDPRDPQSTGTPDSALFDDANERVGDAAGWVTIKKADLNELMNIAKAKDAEEGR